MPELQEVVTNLKAGDPKNLDEAATNLKLIRDAARQAGKHILAKSVVQAIAAVERSGKILINEAAAREQAQQEKETITQFSTTINGKDNNNNPNNNTNNITRNMSQSSKVLAP